MGELVQQDEHGWHFVTPLGIVRCGRKRARMSYPQRLDNPYWTHGPQIDGRMVRLCNDCVADWLDPRIRDS